MSKKFVSLAIDHGTTNSCIAQMTAAGPEVIPAEKGSSILPSAVYYDCKGGLHVGSAARRAIITSSAREGQGYTGYKLHIGSDRRYEFSASGKSLTAPEMGAIVLQTLLRAYQKVGGEDVRSCVITIPAKFKQNAVEGTRAAAAMAGLKYYPLIMEPVAAAMRYGFSAQQEQGQWLVFDLGGGTLDVSLVISRKGRLAVPDGGHAGDDTLGGRYFDEVLAGFVLTQLEGRYKLPDFRTNRKKYDNEWGRFLMAVEEAKIELSTQPESVVQLDTPLCQDGQGREVMVKVRVTRKEYEGLIRPLAQRAVEICRTLLKTNHIPASQIQRLILVGGPSKTPLIRDMLHKELGIRLEYSVDPMTAVAEGAAIWADQVEIPAGERVSVGPPVGDYSLRLECERYSSLPTYQAVGLVDGEPVEGWRVEVERKDGRWKSPAIPVDEARVFLAGLKLVEGEKPVLSEFRTTLLDGQGRILATVDEPQIWYPSLGVENRLANSLRVALAGNETHILIPSGAELPVKKSADFATTKTLSASAKDDELRIAVLESVTDLFGTESELARGCLHVGTLRIKGDDKKVRMDVPIGSEIEVHLSVDESRNIQAVAYIPLLEEKFEAKFVGETFQYTIKELEDRFDGLKTQLAEVGKFQVERPRSDIQEALGKIQETSVLAELEADIARAKAGERDSEVRAYKHILELEGSIREMNKRQMRDRVEVGLREVGKVASGNERQTLDDLARDFSRAETAEEVERCYQSLGELEFAVRGRPYVELEIDLISLSGLRVSPSQHDLFNKACALLERIDSNGGREKLTDSDIKELEAMHLQLDRGYPELYEHRQRKLDELGFGRGNVDLSHITRPKL